MWVFFCWLQISWVCRLILKTMSSRPGLTPMLHSTIGLTAGSAERSPLHQWKASHGGHPHFKEKTFSKSVNTFDNNHMRCLFFIWWHLPTLKWTGATLCTLTMNIMWLLILITYIPDMSTNVTHFTKHMNKMIRAMDTPEASIASLWETLTSSP